MRHQNSVFHAVLKQVPRDEFERLVALHGADDRERGFDSRSHLVALLYAQLAGTSSLREIETQMTSHAARLYHLGAVPARRSTLADANRRRPAAVFTDLFARILQQAHRGLRRALAETTYLIDSTGVRVSGRAAEWARFSAKACGAKLHVIYDADAEQPVYAAVTAAKVNDITAAQAMPIKAGATYVFDLGYYDYRWWAALDAASCRIVTRFKANTPLTVTAERPVAAGSNILSDRIGRLPARQAASRRNPFDKPVREVRVRIESGTVLRILSNDLAATAQQIADLYKRRWAIELFFRWVKQTLRITRFLGTSENAVRIQIATALIAYLLLRMAQAAQKLIDSPLAFARLVRSNLMHRRHLHDLLRPPVPPTNPNQPILL